MTTIKTSKMLAAIGFQRRAPIFNRTLLRSNTILVFKNLGVTLRRAGALGEDDAKMTWRQACVTARGAVIEHEGIQCGADEP